VGRDNNLYHCFVLYGLHHLRGRRCSRNRCYAQDGRIHTFYPIAVETLGPLNENARLLLSDLGLRISAASGDLREVSFLFQRISVVVQRFNTVLLHNSFVKDDQPEKVSFLKFFSNFLTTCGFVLVGLKNNNKIAVVQRRKVRRYRGAGRIRLRLSEQVGLEVSFESVHSTAGSNGKW